MFENSPRIVAQMSACDVGAFQATFTGGKVSSRTTDAPPSGCRKPVARQVANSAGIYVRDTIDCSDRHVSDRIGADVDLGSVGNERAQHVGFPDDLDPFSIPGGGHCRTVRDMTSGCPQLFDRTRTTNPNVAARVRPGGSVRMQGLSYDIPLDKDTLAQSRRAPDPCPARLTAAA